MLLKSTPGIHHGQFVISLTNNNNIIVIDVLVNLEKNHKIKFLHLVNFFIAADNPGESLLSLFLALSDDWKNTLLLTISFNFIRSMKKKKT